MSKINPGDFTVARRGTSEAKVKAAEPPAPSEAEPPSPAMEASGAATPLAARREENELLRSEKQDAQNRLRALKRAKERQVKRMVNVPLDSELKARLQRASIENDVKMTEIMRDAISKYLSENGY